MSNRAWSKEDETSLLIASLRRRHVHGFRLRDWAIARQRSPRAVYLKLMRLLRDPALRPPDLSPASSSPAPPAAVSPQAPAVRGRPGQSG